MKLISPKGDVSRPILDRVKGSLFSVLYKYDLPEGGMGADVFSGVGSLGLEAVSRGAEFVTFVETDDSARDQPVEDLLAGLGDLAQRVPGVDVDHLQPERATRLVEIEEAVDADLHPVAQVEPVRSELRGESGDRGSEQLDLDLRLGTAAPPRSDRRRNGDDK